MEDDHILKWFAYGHVPERLRVVHQAFRDLATLIMAEVPPGPERTVAMRKLLEGKDSAVRATISPGG